MSKFITGLELEETISKIIWETKETLLIVSPFIKLDDYFKKLFDNHLNNPKIHILIVFGKNENNISRSLSKNDFEYFKKFLNISIIYVPNLHAKYYGNEKKGVITSINLYDYSFKNNIEFGVYSELNIVNKITNKTEKDAWETCWKIVEENEAVYIKRPVYQKKMLSLVLGKNYVKSDVLLDTTDKFYFGYGNNNRNAIKTILDFKEEIILGSEKINIPTRTEIENPANGFCIRTGQKIPFNPKMPFCDYSYQSWKNFSNYDYKENYCHRTGKESFGKTSMRKPIL
jgi:hypothetical protein